MKTIVIPGYSTKNKDWLTDAKNNLKDLDITVYPWPHWEDQSQKFSPQVEAKKIKDMIGESEVNIIAHSIGTLVATLIVKTSPQSIKKLILAGVPINDLNDDERHEYFSLNNLDPKQIHVFQNSNDEHGNFEEVRRFLAQVNPNIEITETSGGTHKYPYFDEFKTFLTK